ncbi:MAG: flagellar basal body-associated FliL family protein [Pseudoxanthomonas sp.]
MSDKKAPAKAAADKGEKKKGGKLPLIIAIVAVLAAGGAGAGWYLSSKKAADSEHAAAAPKKAAVPAPAQYLALDPPFVVNLSGTSGPQYLQVEVQLMTRDPIQLEHLKSNVPAIRADLLMLFAQQSGAEIVDVPGRKKLQAAALAEVQKLMTAETGEQCAEGLLFTSFVTQ